LNLVRLAGALLERGIDVAIAPIRDGDDDVLAEAAQRRVPVVGLGGRHGVLAFVRHRIDLVEGWQYGGALAASMLSPFARRVTWNFRHVPVDGVPESRATRALLPLLAALPRVARIHVNSRAAVEAHRRRGLLGDYRVIENGIDSTRFVACARAGTALRDRLRLPSAACVFAHVARFHPHKGHALLLEAFASIPLAANAYLVCVGRGMESVRALAGRLDVPPERLRLLDATSDLVPVYSAADWVVSPSLTESFPTVLAEAMSCGRPCIATDAGDSSELIADTGLVVERGSASALHGALLEALSIGAPSRHRLGAGARERIVREFGHERTADAYLDSFREILEAA
jgi:glycosyltransferase involved in cell wall biosynthesis